MNNVEMAKSNATELGVPGYVNCFVSMSRQEAINRCREIVDDFEKQGINKLGDIPEGKTKQELRDLFTALGQNVKF